MGRRISAHFVFTGVTAPLKKGVVETDDRGTVTAVIDTRGRLMESARLEFYNGILLPGLLCPRYRLPATSPDNPTEKIFRDLDEWFFRNGFVAVNLALHSPETSLPPSRFGIIYQTDEYSEPSGVSTDLSETLTSRVFNRMDEVPRETITEFFLRLQTEQAGENLAGWLSFFSQQAADLMGYAQTLGSIEKGKKPGLNLIEPVQLAELKLLKESRIRRLV